MPHEKYGSATPLRTDNSVDVDGFTEHIRAPVEMFSLNATVGLSPAFRGKGVGKFSSIATTDISIPDHRGYISVTP